MLEALQVSFWLLGSMARKKIRDKIESFKAPAMCRQTSRMKKIEIIIFKLISLAASYCFSGLFREMSCAEDIIALLTAAGQSQQQVIDSQAQGPKVNCI